MILDERAEIGKMIAPPLSSLGRTLVGDVIDIWEYAGGPDLHLVIAVRDSLVSAGAATVEFEIVSDSAGAIATDGSATLHASTGPVPVAELVAGYKVGFRLDHTAERYLGLVANVAVAELTSGKLDVYLTQHPAGWTAGADAL